jgi:hypothetical protein
LPGEHHGGERLARALAPHRLDDQVLILAEQNPAQLAGATQQLRIGSARGPILLGR